MSESQIDEWVERGCDLADEGRHLEAAELFARAIEAGEPWVGLNLGNSYLALGELDQAIEAFRPSWIEGGEDNAGYNLRDALLDAGREGEAGEVEAELRDRGYPVIEIEDAIDAANSGEVDRALKMLRGVVDSTDNPRIEGYAVGVIGHLLYHKGDPSARDWLIRGQDFYHSARCDLGELLVNAGERDAGIAVWRQGVAENEVASAVPLANLLWDQGEEREAIALLERFTHMDLHARENLEIMIEDLRESES